MAIVSVSQALADENPRGPWNALPETYQSEINSLIQEFGEVVDPVMWDKGFSIAARVTKVLSDKQEFIFANQMVSSNRRAAELAAAWPNIVGLLSTILSSDIANREKLKGFDVGTLMDTTGVQMF